jgi:hypothetical protein
VVPPSIEAGDPKKKIRKNFNPRSQADPQALGDLLGKNRQIVGTKRVWSAAQAEVHVQTETNVQIEVNGSVSEELVLKVDPSFSISKRP